MENEVMTGDLLFVNKFIYGGTSPRNIPFTNTDFPGFAFRDFAMSSGVMSSSCVAGESR